MKKIITLIFGVLVAIPAICQFDTTGLTKEDVYVSKKVGSTTVVRLSIALRKALVQNIGMGTTAVYYPETNVVGGNAYMSLAKLLTYQLPLSTQVSQAQLDSISKYILKITEPTSAPPKPDVITDIDDKVSETRNKYTLAWTASVNAPWNANHFGNTASYTLVKDGSLETTFDGYKVEWFTEKRVNHGIAAVSIDGGAEVMVDLYDPRTDNPSMKVWTSPVLTSGTHKIKIRCTLTKSNTSAGTDTNIIHDYFKVYKKQP